MGDCTMEIKSESTSSFYFCFFSGRGAQQKTPSIGPLHFIIVQ